MIFKTTNYGQSWTSISGDLPMLAVNDIEVMPGNENTIFIANDAGVYYTTNGGTNWMRLGNNLPFVAVLDIDLNYNNSKIIAGTFGRSIYTIDISALPIGINQQEDKTVQLNLFPNPATDRIKITSSGTITSIVAFDMQGKEVARTNGDELIISSLVPGNYGAEISVGNKKYRKKFIKQ